MSFVLRDTTDTNILAPVMVEAHDLEAKIDPIAIGTPIDSRSTTAEPDSQYGTEEYLPMIEDDDDLTKLVTAYLRYDPPLHPRR